MMMMMTLLHGKGLPVCLNADAGVVSLITKQENCS